VVAERVLHARVRRTDSVAQILAGIPFVIMMLPRTGAHVDGQRGQMHIQSVLHLGRGGFCNIL
jgi:hypothetical protein